MTENNHENDEEEEEVEETAEERHWRSAYWAAVSAGADTYGGAYRGTHPVPHGGAATVKPEDTLGTVELCWCGLPAGHDWPGKTIGAKHPKEGSMNTQTSTTLDRRDLRAYHSRLQDFLLQCVNVDGLRFRVTRNSVILYPPDASQPMSVGARNSDRQVRSLQKWYVEHVVQQTDEEEKVEVPAAMVEELVKKVNDPVEHPLDPPKQQTEERPPVAPSVTEEAAPKPPRRAFTKAQKDKEDRERAQGQWVPYVNTDEVESTLFETNGTQYRCKECAGTDHEYLKDRRSIGGHTRMWHTDRTDLHSPETRAVANETRRLHKAQEGIIEAIEALIPLVPEGTYPTMTEVDQLKRKVAELEGRAAGYKRQRDEARAAAPDVDVEALTKRADDAEARLALMREALGV
jgi:hypothetical protein